MSMTEYTLSIGPELCFPVRSYSSVTSTNQLAKEAADGGAPDGLVILADHQTAGRNGDVHCADGCGIVKQKPHKRQEDGIWLRRIIAA